jgi:hypothetical protein
MTAWKQIKNFNKQNSISNCLLNTTTGNLGKLISGINI